jgi:hypothetical protein
VGQKFGYADNDIGQERVCYEEEHIGVVSR